MEKGSMKTAIITRIGITLILALLISGTISSIASYWLFQHEIKGDMTDILLIVDSTLDRSGDVAKQLEQYQETLEERYRFTLIDQNGTVVADTGVRDVSQMENHRERPEVQDAMNDGIGYESRFSDTFATSMIYAAIYSKKNQDILRLSQETAAMSQILLMTVEVFLSSFLISLALAAVLTARLTRSITSPLMEIAKEMSEFEDGYHVFHFRKYPYKELNIIADTTTSMSNHVREAFQKREKEKQVRQEFFSNASHELKTPLTAIRGYAELLQSGMAQDEDTKNMFLNRIHREVEGMTELVNDILKISRLETKETTPCMETLQVTVLAEEIVSKLQPAAAAAGVSIQMKCESAEFYMNRTHFEEIVSNLISNAIKYNQSDGRVNLDVRRQKDRLVIEVEDTGIGISPEDQSRVFERFFRVDKGRSKRIGGTGLGLSIVKHTVGYYGGSITLRSKPGEGSCFTVTLPLIHPQE
ncbi:MAG: GHKL domain-containing protein [Lachnospiraceae bacterium]|nr:GHKL domain-containing protein [Lachnospiraceae bacterium]